MSANSKITTRYLQNLRSLNWEVALVQEESCLKRNRKNILMMAVSDTQACLFHLSTVWDPCAKRLRRIAIMFYIYVNFLSVPVQVTFCDDAILISSLLHQIPLAMLNWHVHGLVVQQAISLSPPFGRHSTRPVIRGIIFLREASELALEAGKAKHTLWTNMCVFNLSWSTWLTQEEALHACHSVNIVADALISDFDAMVVNLIAPPLGFPVQVTSSHDASLVSSLLHQIPLAMLVRLFWIALVVCCPYILLPLHG
ncbi:hypothetical protein SCA6_018160 [Theobroma cacao]